MDTDLIIRLLITGLGATLCMDVWSLFQRHVLAIPSLDYALVGRWILWMPSGRFYHQTIGQTPACSGEKGVGWGMHYLTGTIFAFLPFCLAGHDWYWQPTLYPALLAGIISLFAPFMVMQPAFGFGIAAAKTPRHGRARLLSVLTHLIYGGGLYLSAWVIARVV
ncbi:DUF2938 domain-containing protein [Kosakonia sp.]|uniref:DUF2938 domain-containing protein n=1 Tax=Kosakonia sp. TaxID=1916651 RepID=UPI0028A1E271|nr:DUF2938 domain-containing protein [Kosakonia sp.]